MKITVTFRHHNSSEPLKQYTENKIGKLSKYLGDNFEAHVVMTVEKFRQGVEIDILYNGFHIKGEEVSNDMYSSIDLASDKITRQLKKYKEKLKEHKFTQPDIAYASEKIISVQESETDVKTPQVVKVEKFYVKPMTVDEAIMQLELTQDNFLVFNNASTRAANVVYRRKDGNFGLIEPNA